MFQNREEAGLLLAQKLKEYTSRKEAIIFAIPRGGVVVGRQLAASLNIPLSLVVVKKLGAPGNPELAIGAVAPSGVKIIDWELALRLGVEQEYLDEEVKRKKEEVGEREKRFKIVNLELQVANKKIIILTDDGVATGATVLAAIKYLKNLTIRNQESKAKIILAVSVIAKDTYNRLKSAVDEIVALEVPEIFGAVGQFYQEFPQVTDEEVIKMLEKSIS